ncbi:MAG TPA: ATP-binding protein, partial [Kofleriaceae bacterium]
GFVGRSFRTTVVPIRDPDGTGGRVMIVAVETTEQRQARESLERQACDLELARREAVEAGRAKDQFLAMLGHELRNPLAPMLTAVQVMELEGTTSPALGIIERQLQQLTRLVDDLLDISRIARGMVVLHRQDIEIATLVNRALEIVSPVLDQRGHRIVTDFHRGLGVSVDPDRLAQVIANLITNAAKYSEPESQIRIVGERSGDRVVLTVSDHGIGIAPEMLQRVFEPFVQQPQTLDRSQGGLGLGLSIVKSLVEAHGGTVSAHSDGLGCGSTFVVELPATEGRRTPTTGAMRAVSVSRPVSRVATTPLRILVVDDNYEAADILEIALSALGHSIAIAYDGASALEIAKTHAPQIALVDLGLPVMNGYSLAEALRAAHHIPVVAITGFGQDSDRQRTHAAGFAAHLVKPVDLHELADLVSRLCEEHNAD